MVDIVRGLFEINEVDIQWAVPLYSLLCDVSQCNIMVPESRLFWPQCLVNNCLDSSKTNSTENFAGDGQSAYTSH